MNIPPKDAPLSPDIAAEADSPEETTNRNARVWNVLGAVVSVGLVAAILLQLGGATTNALRMILRLPLAVWPVLLLLYLVQPLGDLVIYRRLWNLPVAGFEALLRKTAINEVVVGYSGEAYLYVWARRMAGSVATPFRAIKDVNILSALLGNLFTVGLAAISATQLKTLDLAQRLGPALWSGLVPVAASVGLLAFGSRVFSLRPKQLAFTAAIHTVRLIAALSLTVLVWRMSLPQVAPGVWLVLLAVRYLVSRIPFLSNKDLVFGNLMLLVLGAHSSVAELLAALALVTLFMHLTVIVGLGIFDLVRGLRTPADRDAARPGSTGTSAP
ncbi:hypothetical protein [Caulobacter sp. SSI4214]|uniref:hypothetical protein n=1 Tax=Caulobacter sp. SSI4214 TaxID=2575739 RepID=UPI00143B58D1|nr:hypothetical protein [Caulobacter sp. SSI4214]